MRYNPSVNIGPRAGLQANQEVLRANSGHGPEAFGVVRKLEDESRDAVLGVTDRMRREGFIPPKVTLRDELGITLLSRSVVQAQLRHGALGGYALKRAGEFFDNSDVCEGQDESLAVDLTGVNIFEGRGVYATIDSDSLKDEIQGICDILSLIGLRGDAKTKKPVVPHLTLGETAMDNPLSQREQRRIKEEFNRYSLPSLQLLPWDIYPEGALN